MKIKNFAKRFLIILLSAAMLVGSAPNFTSTAQAAPPKYASLWMCKTAALSHARAYKKIRVQIIQKRAKYESAVQAINMKKRRLRTFSWKPLISFKLPQTPGYTEEYEFAYQPLQIQSEIRSLMHDLTDKKFEVYEQTEELYISIYSSQEKIKFQKQRLAEMEKTLKRNQAKVLTGAASQDDVDNIQKSVDKLTQQISTEEKNLEKNKEKMYDKTQIDVRSGYTFLDPYEDSSLSRGLLKQAQEYTLANSQTIYDAKLDKELKETSMNTYYNILWNKYGGIVPGTLNTYISRARMGLEVDEEQLKRNFDWLLEQVNDPWTGGFRVLFWKLKYSWFQGESDGRNYVEDDPYALYNAILEFSDAVNDYNQTVKDVNKEVDEGLDNVLNMGAAYKNYLKQEEGEKKELEKFLILNQLGDMSYDEYSDAQKNYEELELSVSESLDSYTKALCAFDRLTCGWVTKYLYGADNDNAIAFGGNSWLVKDIVDGMYYNISFYVEDNVFELSIIVSDDIDIEITDFELWVDDIQVGERTPINKSIKHLALVTGNADKAKLRFYNGANFVDDVEIDPSVYYAPIELTKGYHVKQDPASAKIGTFAIGKNDKTGMEEFTFIPTAEYPEIAFYKLVDKNGNELYSEDYVASGEKMIYLPVLSESTDSFLVYVYDETLQRLYKGVLKTSDYSVVRDDMEAANE